MKKGIVRFGSLRVYCFGFVLMFAIGALSAGCCNAENGTEQQDSHEHGTFICPMDCEAGKTYEEAGACPVCKMGLAEVENS